MIVRIGVASAEANTVTIPAGHQVGDLIIVWAFRDGSTTNPTIPAGWNTITNTTDGTLCSISMGWKFATSAAETSGTWTNATSMACHVYRGTKTDGTPVGTVVGTATTGATQTWAALTIKSNTSWIAGFVGHRSTDTTALTTPPTGMTNVSSTLGSTSDVASHDSNGTVGGNYATNGTTSGGTNSGAITAVIEIFGPTTVLNNYQAVRSTSAGVISVGERIR